jgi:nicotinamide-nucleotide amidase
VFGENDDGLHDVLVRMLRERGETLATVECDSGGLMAQWLGEADSERAVYLGGSVVRDSAAIARAAGVERAQLLDGAVDPKAVVREMAIHCRDRFEADYALALGPFPGAVEDKSARRSINLALAGPEGAIAKTGRFAGHPDIRTPRAVKQALNLLRLTLIE